MNHIALSSNVSLINQAPASGTGAVTARQCGSPHLALNKGALKLCKAAPALLSALFARSLSDPL